MTDHVPIVKSPMPTREQWARYNPEELLATYAQLVEELLGRGVVRTTNNPVGDYGEYLTARALNLTLVGNSGAGYDAVSDGGIRYQVKSRRPTSRNKSRQLGFIRGLEDGKSPFDWLVGVIFEPDFGVHRAALIPIEVIRANVARVDYVNGWRFILRESVWGMSGVVDITHQLRRTAAEPAVNLPRVRGTRVAAPEGHLKAVASSQGAGHPKILDRPLPDGLDSRALLPRSLRNPTPDEEAQGGVVAAYQTKNFTVYRAVVDRLADGERFRMESPNGTFEFTAREFRLAFPALISTASYQGRTESRPGAAYYTIGRGVPSAAVPFRVTA